MKQPIRRQLLMPLLAVLVPAALGIAVCAAWLNLSRQATLLQERQENVSAVLEEATFPLTAAVLQKMERLSGQRFVVWDAARARVVESSWEHPPVDLPRIAAGLELPQASAHGEMKVELHGETYVVRAIPLRRKSGLFVLIFTSRRALVEARWAALWPPLALGGGALLLIVPWLLHLTRGWSRRIENIQQLVAGIARGDAIPPPVEGGRDDELRALVSDVCHLSRRLQQLQSEVIQSERERLVAQLAAGFAHQIRNGIAGASLAIELHAGRCGASREQSLEVARKQLRLLETEIRGLLSLARRAESPRESLKLSAVLDDAVDLIMPAVEHRKTTLERRVCQGDAVFTASRDGLRSAVLNLLLNALDAAGPNGRVAIQGGLDAGGVTVAVRDSGPGPSNEVAGRMTDAFVTTKSEGLGLGLTIVAAVAHDHGGRLSWRREGDWTVVELWLPLERRASDESCAGGG